MQIQNVIEFGCGVVRPEITPHELLQEGLADLRLILGVWFDNVHVRV